MPSLLILLLFAAALAIAGAASAAWLWGREDTDGVDRSVGPLEAVASATLLTIFLAAALDWALAPLHGIRCAVLVSAALFGAVLGGIYLWRVVLPTGRLQRGARALLDPGRDATLLSLVALLIPLALWVAFAIWRGTLTPVLSDDALSYHLPRAVDIARTGTWRYLPVIDPRLASFPATYEMLLADVLLLTGSDQATSLLNVLSYLSAFIMGCAFVERRWGSGPRAWLAGLLWAGTPLALLHSVGHKNDTLTMVCLVATALWGARWVVGGGTAPLVLMLVGAALGVGIKPSGVFAAPAVVLGFAPYGLLRRVRSTFTSTKKIAALLGGSAVLLALTGFVPHVAAWVHRNDVVSVPPMDAERSFQLNLVSRFGDWGALWKFPTLLFLAPFSSNPLGVWVPWRHEYWFWPRYQLNCGNFGVALSVLAALVPVVLFALRRPSTGREAEREHAAATTCLLLFAAFVLQIHFYTEGFFNGTPRYLFFLPLLVVSHGAVRALDAMRATQRRVWATAGAMVLAAGVMMANAIDVGTHDTYASISYLQSLMEHPGDRAPPASAAHAAVVLDRLAGPRDRVVLDCDLGSYVHPTFGRDLGREVTMLPVDEGARRAAVDAADWVVVDRHSFEITWGDPRLTDMGRFWELRGHGAVDPRECAFLDAMRADARFEPILDDGRSQAVFRRRHHDHDHDHEDGKR